MAKSSEEGTLPGLGWINATVKKFDLPDEYYVPHMGWNTFSLSELMTFSMEQTMNLDSTLCIHFILI